MKKLDAYEEDILAAYDQGNLKSTSPTSFLQNAGFVEDLFAADGEVKEERAAISGMMRLPSQSS